MKVLLDENIPLQLKKDLAEHRVFTMRTLGWDGIKNGNLLKLLLANKFDVLITFDKHLEFQQNFNKWQIPVLVVTSNDNTYPGIKHLVPKIRRTLLSELKFGVTKIS